MDPRSPVIILFGSSFPIWIFAALGGLLAALALREVLILTGINRQLPAAPLFHFAVALILGILIYVFWIGGYR